MVKPPLLAVPAVAVPAVAVVTASLMRQAATPAIGGGTGTPWLA